MFTVIHLVLSLIMFKWLAPDKKTKCTTNFFGCDLSQQLLSVLYTIIQDPRAEDRQNTYKYNSFLQFNEYSVTLNEDRPT